MAHNDSAAVKKYQAQVSPAGVKAAAARAAAAMEKKYPSKTAKTKKSNPLPKLTSRGTR